MSGYVLASDWADRLTVAETQEIVDHWSACVQYWSAQSRPLGLFESSATDLAVRQLAIVESRVKVWSEVLKLKLDGVRKVQYVVDRIRLER